MSTITTEFAQRCLRTLDVAVQALNSQTLDEATHDIYRAACVKEFEIVSEQCAKLLKKTLAAYFSSVRAVDELTYKDVFRHASKHALLSLEQVERWMSYRDHRNQTAHEYGQDYANAILGFLPAFIQDARELLQAVERVAKSQS